MRFLFLFLLIPIISVGQTNKSKLDFSIIFASCFDQDTVTLSVNGVLIEKESILKSDFSTGLTQLGVYQNEEGLWIQTDNEKTNKRKISHDKFLNIQTTINGSQSENRINLKKGKILVLDYCYTQVGHGTPRRVLTIRQHKKTLIFE